MTDANRASPAVRLKEDGLVDRVVSAGLWGAGLAWLGSMMGVQMAMHRVVHPRNMQWIEHRDRYPHVVGHESDE